MKLSKLSFTSVIGCIYLGAIIVLCVAMVPVFAMAVLELVVGKPSTLRHSISVIYHSVLSPAFFMYLVIDQPEWCR